MNKEIEYGYGFFCGGDPTKFHPDEESCSEQELENHKLACKLWRETLMMGKTPSQEECPSSWLYDKDGKATIHVLRAPYGIGTYEINS